MQTHTDITHGGREGDKEVIRTAIIIPKKSSDHPFHVSPKKESSLGGAN